MINQEAPGRTVRPATESLRSVIRVGFYALLLFAPLPFGSVLPWSVLGIELSAAVLAAVALMVVARDPATLPRSARILAWPAGILLAVGVLHMIPFPPAWTRAVAAPTAAVRAEVAAVVPGVGAGWLPSSLEPPATLDALCRLVAYGLLAVAAAVGFRKERELRSAAVVMAVSGAFQALYGTVEYISGHQHIFWYAKRYFQDDASGTFINRNHFAGFLALTLPFALGLSIDGLHRLPSARSWRKRLVVLGDAPAFYLAGGAFATALIWVGIICSYSRAGLALGLLAAGLVAIRVSGRRWAGSLVLVAVLVPSALILWKDIRPPGARFAAPREELASLSGRVPVWTATLKIIPDYLPFGAGPGTFEYVFSMYRPPWVRNLYEHAHNDWLQSAVEWGPGGPVVAAWILFILVGLRRRRRLPTPPVVLSASVWTALLVLALNAMVDFPLRIPAIAIVGAFLVGVGSWAVPTGVGRASR